MGSFTVTATNLITHTPTAVYDFVSNPHNWPLTYEGSASMDSTVQVPLNVGDTWTETVRRGDFEFASTWRLEVAERPRKFEFRQIDGIGARPDGSGGVPGFTSISYLLEPTGATATLFTRTMVCELPHGVRIPDQLLIARAQPAGIDGYHDAIQRLLDGVA